MSRFNSPIVGPTLTTNLAGGDAHKQSAELSLISLLLTSFAQDTFYKKADETFADLKNLLAVVDPLFGAQALVYARTVFGMRSITHVGASAIAPRLAGYSFAKLFYDRIVHRLDDMTEILAYHISQKQKMSKAMQKGFKKAFDQFEGYELAKYRSDTKDFKLVDAINLVHPKPNQSNSTALKQLMKGELKNVDTWEAKISAAGSDKKAKSKAWSDLLIERKLGYMATLRNLRNIIEQAPSAIPLAVQALTSEQFIKASLIIPFNYQKALEEIEKMPSTAATRIVALAIHKALDISVSNVPKLEGTTLIALDTSQSMTDRQYEGKPAKIGALFAVVLAKANNADFMTFDNVARYVTLNHANSTLSEAKNIQFLGGGTNFHSIFSTANRKYDNIVILSDMQAWIGQHTPRMFYNAYRTRTKADANIFTFDLAGLPTMQFPERKVFALAGFSDKVFTVMNLLQRNPKALIDEVKAIGL